jgi:hypothetical protein
MHSIAGLPFWRIAFDRAGSVHGLEESAFIDESAAAGVTDLLIFSHGWNNDAPTASRLYENFFALVPPLLDGRADPERTVGLVGVYWPSMRWPDEVGTDATGVTAAVDLAAGSSAAAAFAPVQQFAAPPPPSAAMRALLQDAFPAADPAQIADLLTLLETRPDDESELRRLRDLLRSIAASGQAESVGDDGEGQSDALPEALSPDRDTYEVYDAFRAALEDTGVVTGSTGGAASLASSLEGLWHGAQEVARQVTYWQMKQRAGTVGERGLGPLLARLSKASPNIRINLIGHSFGCRLVSFALRGLPVEATSAVRSVTLLEAAFSHFAFAGVLPFDMSRSGALAGVQARVDGPVVACYSRYDSAVGTFYPLASLARGQDASDLFDPLFRWQAMGHDGHQPESVVCPLHDVGEPYAFEPGSLVSIDASAVVRHGRPPSGAHSDIFHQQLAWIPLSAGRIAVSA